MWSSAQCFSFISSVYYQMCVGNQCLKCIPWHTLLVDKYYNFVIVMCESIPTMSIPPQANPWTNPGLLKKLVKCPALRANFSDWQISRPPFLLWWSNARPPSPSDQFTKIVVAIFFNKHIKCFSSIELHKTGHEMSHSDSKKIKQMVLLFL